MNANRPVVSLVQYHTNNSNVQLSIQRKNPLQKQGSACNSLSSFSVHYSSVLNHLCLSQPFAPYVPTNHFVKKLWSHHDKNKTPLFPRSLFLCSVGNFEGY